MVKKCNLVVFNAEMVSIGAKKNELLRPQHWWGKSIKLNEKSIGGPFGGASAEAWLCEKCKKIVIEY
ncbi:hypothetical protein CBW42_13965 [Butyricicoccus porcorum]|uniref:DUF6487 domain-containing protein n=2 Tax=Butyricicoccus porcorum TaxID=1945634 RepID=A0A252F0P8_9FIRM|nr:hypothetical protein CBW42_13965 [Butyricicoccus porcorum]